MAGHSALCAARLGRRISCGERTPALVTYAADFFEASDVSWACMRSIAFPVSYLISAPLVAL